MASPPNPDFSGLLARLSQTLEQRHIPFMLIGGQAVLLHGHPRVTEDIDVCLGVDPTQLSTVREVCTALALKELPADVEKFVRETFVLPAKHEPTAIRIDFVFSTTPYERQAIARAVLVELGGAQIPFAAAEDLIIHKLFAGRPRDLEDAVGVVRRKGAELDWAYVERWANEFAKVPGREKLPADVARLRNQ